MSISNWFRTSISLIKKDIVPAFWTRTITTGNPTLCEVETAKVQEEEEENKKRVIHPLEKCLEYMDSKAYKLTYGDKPVWHVYVRNFKGGRAPQTRRDCWRFGKLNRGSPCPICRDQYLLPHYLNIKLLKQFISPYGGHILDRRETGVCYRQQQNLEVAIKKAQNYGLLTFLIPPRPYNYSYYIKNLS